METFYVSKKGKDNTNFEQLNASTLRGAKCEATQLYGGGFLGDHILIAIRRKDDPFNGLETIASKVIGEDRWSTSRKL